MKASIILNKQLKSTTDLSDPSVEIFLFPFAELNLSLNVM